MKGVAALARNLARIKWQGGLWAGAWVEVAGADMEHSPLPAAAHLCLTAPSSSPAPCSNCSLSN